MKTLLKLEELAMFLLCVIAIYAAKIWWLWLILFIAPDISMLGYFVNNKVGAYCYNLFHHKGVAILISVLGFAFGLAIWKNTEWVVFTGVAMFGHSSMDRFFGFGLKSTEGFKFTHLGKLGEN